MDYVTAYRNWQRSGNFAHRQNRGTWSWFIVIVFIVNTIIFIQVMRGIYNTIMLLYLQRSKRQEVAHQYIRLVEYKNKLDTVTAKGYLDYILKNNLQLYNPGEKLVIIDQALLTHWSNRDDTMNSCEFSSELRSRYLIQHGVRALYADRY